MQDEIAQPRLKPEAAPTAYAWLVLGMLWFVYVLNFLDRQLLSILAKPIQDSLGVTDGQLGLITGLYFALFYCLISIPVGWLADRTNRVKVLAIACGVWSAATAGCGAAANYGQLVGARMMVGVGEAGGVPPSYAIISDYFPPGRRGTALGIFNLGPPIGQALGVAFGAAIAVSLELAPCLLHTGRHWHTRRHRRVLRHTRTGSRRPRPHAGETDREGRLLAARVGASSATRRFCWRRLAAARRSSSPMGLAISRCCSCSARKA